MGGKEPRPEEEDDWLMVVEAVLPEPMELGRGYSKPLCEQYVTGTDNTHRSDVMNNTRQRQAARYENPT